MIGDKTELVSLRT